MLPLRNSAQTSALTELISRAVDAEVDLLQIREPELSVRDVLALADFAAGIARGSNTRILVNDRADIASSAGAGVHLTTRSLNARVVREAFGSDFLIGASTHSLEEAQNAARGGVDFVVFGPIFETESKLEYGPPVGLEALGRVTSVFQIPVLALGGINEQNFRQALEAGAAGIAGISIFSEARDLQRLVKTIKSSTG
jgi:thiamine-phosphate pyrophosphorylase